MKALCISTEKTLPGLLEVGKEYEVSVHYPGYYRIGQYDDVPQSNFESPLNRFKRLFQTANKMLINKPTTGVIVEILATDDYLVLYSHTKGNSSNVFGNHYQYFHDINTGEFTPNAIRNQKVIIKERFLMADYKELQAILVKRQTA